MEGNNGMEKIISQTPENEGVSEKSIEQQAGVENPFAFEKECIARLNEYLKEQFPKTYTRPSLEDWLKALHKANVSLKEYQKFQEALLLLGYEKTDDTNPFEFKIMDDDGGESSHTAYKLKEFGSFSVYVDSKYIGDLSTIGGEAGRKERGAELFLLALNLQEQNNSFTPDMVVKRCKEILKGKRILSLGDDIGSLSE